jgi:hypothetical protein
MTKPFIAKRNASMFEVKYMFVLTTSNLRLSFKDQDVKQIGQLLPA